MLNKIVINLVLIFVTCLSFAKSNLQSKVDDNYFLLNKTYIIQLKEPPITTYQGGTKNLAATTLKQNNKPNSTNTKLILDIKSKASEAYADYLQQQQLNTLTKASIAIKRQLSATHSYHTVFNGFSLKLTPTEAANLRALPNIKSVTLERKFTPQTDRGPLLINAPSAWDGSASGVLAKGEGMLIGIIDTGIRSNHPSFAEIDPSDGYTHINPLGNDNFLGYCATNVGFCNNKLIGAYSFVDTIPSPDDENEHGTHVASTVAGNHLSFDLGGGNSMDLSGVAPHANIIAYRIADIDGVASSQAILDAIEQAVIDGVDVINFSFGSSAYNPWLASDSVAFRNARAAGVIVVTSAGNSGPNSATIGSPADAPWLTSVAASTHDRGSFPTKTLSSMTGGSTTAPATITGRSLTGALTGSIVYAGNFSNADPNPEQCLTPFPAGTFNGEIVVCDRGEIARVEKAQNVAAGGAGGYILANVQNGATFLADDIYVIPGIHIVASDGDILKTWLANGSGHTATINGTTGVVGVNSAAADIVAAFSSRGPNPTVNDVIKPSVSAPGVSILAATIAPIDYAFLQGTSMSSPHVAGAAALIKQVKPSWSAGQIHSALMTTAKTNLTKENQITPADVFDIGGGRIDINLALNAGLLMDETDANFKAADPQQAGIPKTLNLPSISDSKCNRSCSWTRRVSAAVADSWNVSFITDSGLTLAVTPANFTLTQTQLQDLNITASVNGSDGDWLFGKILLTPSDLAITTTHLPVAVQVSNSTLPKSFNLISQRNAGQHKLTNIKTLATNSLIAQGFISLANPQQKTLSADSDNSSAFDDLTDGVTFQLINIAAGEQLLFAQTSNSTATDLDLFVGIDLNGDGRPQEFELLQSSTSPDANEQIVIIQPNAGNYWVLVQNWDGAATGTDSYTSIAGKVGNMPSSNLSFNLPAISDGVSPFDIAINYNNINQQNSQYFGVVTLGTAAISDELGVSAFILDRESNDVSLNVLPTTVTAGNTVTITTQISPNSNELRNYITSFDVPADLTVNTTSLTNGATISNNIVSWNIAITGTPTSFSFEATVDSSLLAQSMNLATKHSVDTPNTQQETAIATLVIQAEITPPPPPKKSSGGGTLIWLLLFLPWLIRKKH